MVLGIVSLVLMFTCGLGFIAAIVALVMAGGAEREVAQSGGALQGEGQIKAGRIMSWITARADRPGRHRGHRPASRSGCPRSDTTY